ncbi:MAG: ferritin-like domain-containing protein [Isosphaeraceae bacterium]|nr:ferritin-like domain-containing protein [Isosphaeraceae bacterium]
MREHTFEQAAVQAPNGEQSRRSFLKRTVSVAATTSAFVAIPRQARAQKPVRKPFGRLPDLFPGQNLRNFLEILQDEEDHITQLTKLADNPRPMPTFQNLVAATPVEFVEMAAMIENGGVGSYLQGLNAISEGGHHDYFLTAAGITAVEAQHTGFLNSLLDSPIAPSALANTIQPGIATPIPPQQIQNAIGPFVVSLNGGPPFTYNINQVDDANDQAIINFVLLLEFLEVEFYRSNIQKFARFF